MKATYAPLVKSISRGVHVVEMVKDAKQRYVLGHQKLSLKELYQGLFANFGLRKWRHNSKKSGKRKL